MAIQMIVTLPPGVIVLVLWLYLSSIAVLIGDS
jgi:uncharacterized BrkB/YihY/UPF0761 family membrane protein